MNALAIANLRHWEEYEARNPDPMERRRIVNTLRALERRILNWSRPDETRR